LRQSIAATLIAGAGVKSGRGKEDFHRCLLSLDPVVDKIFVTYNGEGELPEVPEGIKVVFTPDGWNEDFAMARNFSFDAVHRYMDLNQTRFDWILWVDTDDTLEGDIHGVINSLDPKTQVVMLRYDYAVDPATEQVLAVQWRERLFRTDMPTKWVYPIHEVCRFPVGTQVGRKDGAWVRHWREPKHERTDSRERNRKILARARKEFPNEPRFKYYFANEVYAEAALSHFERGEHDHELINAAITAYEDFIPDAPSPDDAYLASHQVAELQRMADNHEGAIEADLRSLMIHPTWPDAYVGIAQSYMHLEDWDKVEFWAGAVLKVCAQQDTTQVREPLNDEYLPRLLIGIAAEHKGRLHEALDIYKALDEQNLAKEVKDRITSVKEKILRTYSEQNLVPTQRVDDRARLFGTQPEKSIAFFTAPLFEEWHPELMKDGGIGGAETCVMEVAKRFAADGWRTVVFGTPGKYRGIHAESGVEYWDADDFSPTEPFTVFVSSRVPQIFDANMDARTKMLWMHDVNSGENPFEGEFWNRLDQIDYVIGLTDWHCQHLHRLYNIPPHKLVKIPNGVDLDRFGEIDESKRQKHKFVFSSSPDRGIDVVLNVWPKLKTRFPDAELHVYYGWNSIDKILDFQPQNPLGRFKEGVMGIIEEMGGEDYGIFWHNRVTQTELAEALKTCHAWLYPTYFMETFCITAVEMQAAGVIPITSNVAALQETVALPELRIEGWPNNVSFLREYTDTVIRTLGTTSGHQRRLREAGYEHAHSFTWDNAFEDWKTAVSELVPA
jgi:glycosyltransferase involved in cell wall biosynthesis